MSGGLFNTSSQVALLLAAGLAFAGTTVSANAADLGGDCCADLEERVAELEATTVRKGNRKISLTLSGRVHEAVMYWNDGVDDDIYVVQPDITRNRFGFAGKGKVDSNLEIGFNMVIRPTIGRGRQQRQDYRQVETIDVETQTVFLADKRFGKLEWGFRSSGFRDLISGSFDLGGTTNVYAKADVGEWVDSFVVGTNTWANVLRTGKPTRNMQIRYDSPAVNGFVLSASWGDDDVASANLNYDGKFGDTQVRAGVGYNLNTRGGNATPAVGEVLLNGADFEQSTFVIGGGVYNAPSGLFLSAEYASTEGLPLSATLDAEDRNFYWVKGGWRNKVNAYGQTAIYMEYAKTENALSRVVGTTVETADGEMFGVGIGQDIDPVGATAYLAYRKHSLQDNGTTTGVAGCGPTAPVANKCDDLDVVMGGMIVNF